MVNFSRPLQKKESQVDVAGPQTQAEVASQQVGTLRRENVTYFDRRFFTKGEDSLPVANDMAALHDFFNQPGTNHAEDDGLPQTNMVWYYFSGPSPPLVSKDAPGQENDEMNELKGEDIPINFDMTSFMMAPFEQRMAKKPRYYSHALTEKDKRALATGETNHNLKQWTGEDLIRFHESRLDLIHPGLENREELIKMRLEEKERGEQYVKYVLRKEKQVCLHSGLPFMKSTTSKVCLPLPSPSNNPYQASQFSQSAQHLRVSSAPATPAFAPSPLSQVSLASRLSAPSTLSVAPSATSCESLAPTPTETNGSTTDYFSRPLARSTEQQHSRSWIGPRTSTYVSSPLSPLPTEARNYRPRRDVTFDSFLVPHNSGKGEAYRGGKNAKEGDVSGEKDGDSVELKELRGVKKHARRLSKMPSLSAIRVRRTQSSQESTRQSE